MPADAKLDMAPLRPGVVDNVLMPEAEVGLGRGSLSEMSFGAPRGAGAYVPVATLLTDQHARHQALDAIAPPTQSLYSKRRYPEWGDLKKNDEAVQRWI